MPSEPVLVVEHLDKTFPGNPPVHAVRDLSFSLLSGEIVGLLGPNGAGKTTTMRMLLSALTPDSGQILYFGQSLSSDRSAVLQNIGFASAYTGLPLYLSVEESLIVQSHLYGLTRADTRARIDELTEFFGVSQFRRSLVNQLSAGQKTRVTLARAFLHRPRLVLLDEPTASLDPDIAHEVRGFLRAKREREGTTLLLSSHNMPEVSELCDRVLFLKNGALIACGTPRELAHTISSTVVVVSVRGDAAALAQTLRTKGFTCQVQGSCVKINVLNDNTVETLRQALTLSTDIDGVRIEEPNLEDFFMAQTESRPG